ncbi:TetR/AcrR family transcriptional regulator [Cryptosporangium phraense]|uniref:TetR/AcrR family transcriptional regulator n=1 Tax=Cryptosporangium phraense TaxID=2593070 RepID=A0A545AI67_9ACTN|nr:TetR/AcrR family transcriptional regulator [Cryptosporangium phraense]TQS41011.1 TetR/AcrR family transcriptional regulator [Cryptosporangium phraense]
MTAEAQRKVTRRRPARRGEGDRLRDEIVLAACALLNESGDPGTLSLRAVARKTGVATTSIYLHFEDLTSLVRAVKSRWLDMLADEVEAAASEAGDDPRKRVRAIAHAYVDAAMREPARYRVLFTAELTPPAPGVPYLGVQAYNSVLARVRQAVPEAEADMITLQFWCGLHGLVTLRQARPKFPWPDLEGQVDDLVTRLIDSATHG